MVAEFLAFARYGLPPAMFRDMAGAVLRFDSSRTPKPLDGVPYLLYAPKVDCALDLAETGIGVSTGEKYEATFFSSGVAVLPSTCVLSLGSPSPGIGNLAGLPYVLLDPPLLWVADLARKLVLEVFRLLENSECRGGSTPG